MNALPILLVDLDDTVYAANSGVWDAIAIQIDRYMCDVLKIPEPEVAHVRQSLFHTYGTTLRGLQLTRHIDHLDFLRFVHDVPIDRMLAPNLALRQVLQALPHRKVIFTNADHHHARRVLHRLELEGCFERIIDILDIDPYCKPMPEAFATALRLLNIQDPQDVIMIDDSPRNLAGARTSGLRTIHVGSIPLTSGCDASITQLEDLPSALSVWA